MNEFLSRPFVFLIRLYQRYISPHKTPSCRFTPTCSQYAIGALREWGPVIGLILALWRIIRCNPFSKGGEDPVPTAPWHKKKKGVAPDNSDGENTPHDQT